MAKKGINDTSDDEDFDESQQGGGQSGEPRGQQERRQAAAGPTREEQEDNQEHDGGQGEEIEIVEDPEDKDGEERGDARLSAQQREGHEDPEETRRQNNRERRKQAKERRQRAMMRDKTELNALRNMNDQLAQRLAAVERGQVQGQGQTIAQRIEQEESRLAQTEALMEAALEANNAKDVVKLTRIRDNVRDRLAGLKEAGERHQQHVKVLEEGGRANGNGRASGGDEMDPIALQNAQVFFNRHRDWYDPTGRDQDSAIVFAVDTAVSNEGYDPRTREYWQEVEKRCQKLLPHRFKKGQQVRNQEHDDADLDDDDDFDDDDDDGQEDEGRQNARGQNGSGRRQAGGKNGQGKNGQRQNGGPRLPGGGSGGGQGNRFYLSPARKKALQDNGLWDDPVLRQRYVKRYQKWDQENPDLAGRA